MDGIHQYEPVDGKMHPLAVNSSDSRDIQSPDASSALKDTCPRIRVCFPQCGSVAGATAMDRLSSSWETMPGHMTFWHTTFRGSIGRFLGELTPSSMI